MCIRDRPDTPQAFIALTSDDPSVAPYHGVNYYLALQKNKVPATLHVYPTGGHGWGFQDHFKYKQQWTQELEKWLRDGVEMCIRDRCMSKKEKTLKVP